MKERIRFVVAAQQKRTTFTALSATFGIAPKTGYKWLELYERLGVDGLRDRSRRPHGNSRAISSGLATRLVEAREEHPAWGPRKIVAWLHRLHPDLQLPAPSTVGELFKRNGLVNVPVERRRRKLPPRSQPLSHATGPNAVWSMDFKGWFLLGDGTRCDPLTITDNFSRYLLCCKAFNRQSHAGVWEALRRTCCEYGMPKALRVDNGQPWAAPKGDLGLTGLAAKILRLGIELERIAPGKPHQNGRHERFHLTLKQETALPPGRSLRSQQIRFNQFKRLYNHDRPHEALKQGSPIQRFTPSSKAWPSRLPEPEYPAWFQIHRVRMGGSLRWGRHEFFISQALQNQHIGLIEVDEGCFEIYFCKLLVGRINTAHPELGLIAA